MPTHLVTRLHKTLLPPVAKSPGLTPVAKSPGLTPAVGCNGVDCEAAAAFAAAVAFFAERGAAFGAGRGAFGAGRAAAFFAERGAAFGGGSTDFFEMGALEEVAAADAGRWRLASASAALAALERERVDGCGLTMFRGQQKAPQTLVYLNPQVHNF